MDEFVRHPVVIRQPGFLILARHDFMIQNAMERQGLNLESLEITLESLEGISHKQFSSRQGIVGSIADTLCSAGGVRNWIFYYLKSHFSVFVIYYIITEPYSFHTILQGVNDRRSSLFAIIGIIGAMAAAFHVYKTTEIQYYLSDATKRIGSLEETTNSVASSSSTQQASISSICEKVLFM